MVDVNTVEITILPSCDHFVHNNSNVKLEEWILVKKEYQTGFTGLFR
jgi:hypothetical protein